MKRVPTRSTQSRSSAASDVYKRQVSRMSRLAHSSVILCGSQPSDDSLPTQYEVRQITGQYRSVSSSFAPFGTLFETAALIFSDAIISALIEAKHCSLDEARTRLSNVQ